jgi:phage FluMu protein Com
MKIYTNENDTLEPVFSEGERFITIFIAPFPIGEKRNLRCINCGKLLLQYEGETVAIVEGGEKPNSKACIEILCTRCRIMYRLIS